MSIFASKKAKIGGIAAKASGGVSILHLHDHGFGKSEDGRHRKRMWRGCFPAGFALALFRKRKGNYTMKQLVWLLLFIPALIGAQTDERYLAGAVPVVDGKVVFSKEFKIPGYSETRIYDIMYKWAKANFNTDTKRIVYANRERGEIAAAAKEYMEFSRTALSLDHARATYRLTMECGDGVCKVDLSGIRYEYEVSYQREPEKYLAEEWITDPYALNKSQTKLNRISGKFRKSTIDLAQAYFEQIGNAFGNQLLNESMAQTPTDWAPTAPSEAFEPSVPSAPSAPAVSVAPNTASVSAASAVPSVPSAPAAPAVPQTAASPASGKETAAPEGFMALPSGNIPATLLDMLSQNRMTVTSVSDTDKQIGQATWAGIGNLFGKQIASIEFAAGKPGAVIADQEMYRLSFYKAGEKAPWMIIECRQQGETTSAAATTVMGEILQVWIK